MPQSGHGRRTGSPPRHTGRSLGPPPEASERCRYPPPSDWSYTKQPPRSPPQDRRYHSRDQVQDDRDPAYVFMHKRSGKPDTVRHYSLAQQTLRTINPPSASPQRDYDYREYDKKGWQARRRYSPLPEPDYYDNNTHHPPRPERERQQRSPVDDWLGPEHAPPSWHAPYTRGYLPHHRDHLPDDPTAETPSHGWEAAEPVALHHHRQRQHHLQMMEGDGRFYDNRPCDSSTERRRPSSDSRDDVLAQVAKYQRRAADAEEKAEELQQRLRDQAEALEKAREEIQAKERLLQSQRGVPGPPAAGAASALRPEEGEASSPEGAADNKDGYLPRHLTARVARHPLAEGEFTLRPGELLNGWPVWGNEDKRLYSGSKEYWLITDESSDMPRSRGYVQSSKPHNGSMPHQVSEWKVYEEHGWEVDRTVSVTATAPQPAPASLHPLQHHHGAAPKASRAVGDRFPSTAFQESTLRSVLGISTNFLKFSSKSIATPVFLSIEGPSGEERLSYSRKEAKHDKRVSLQEVVDVRLGPFSSRSFSEGPTEVSDPGLCFSVALRQATLDFEAEDQKTFLSFVSRLSALCRDSIEAAGRPAPTSVEAVISEQRAVRKRWVTEMQFQRDND
ncbi:hypothetical protein DIPPA_15623 [Diplonema papillatum]|nr:hypothetical protein DIPPA_15623 [Diplonema papillatum]